MFINPTNTKTNAYLDALYLEKRPEGFIWEDALTRLDVKKMSGLIAQYGNTGSRMFNAKRAVGDRSTHEIKVEIEEAVEYKIEDYDQAIVTEDTQIKQFDPPFNNFDEKNVNILRDSANVIMEYTLNSLITNTSVITNYATPANLWDTAQSDPFGDIKNAIYSVAEHSAKPNSVMTNEKVIGVLTVHPDFVSRVSGIRTTISEEDVITILKNQFGLKNIYVSRAKYEQSKLGQASNRGRIFNNDFTVYTKGAPMGGTETLGFNFSYSGQGAREGVDKQRTSEDKGYIWTNYWSRGFTIAQPEGAYRLAGVVS